MGPYLKSKLKANAGSMAQDCLPRKNEVLSLIPQDHKKEKTKPNQKDLAIEHLWSTSL
jgi:hypothetical protein